MEKQRTNNWKSIETWSHLFSIIGVVAAGIAIYHGWDNYQQTLDRDNNAKAVELYNKYLELSIAWEEDTVKTYDSSLQIRTQRFTSYAFTTAEAIYQLQQESTGWHEVIFHILCTEGENLREITCESMDIDFKRFLEKQRMECERHLDLSCY